MRVISKKFLVPIVTLLVFSAIAPVAAGTTWYVDDDAGSDFTTIQDAVDAASGGDTIIVKDGTYSENVDVDKSITLKSENGAANCIIDAGGSGTTINLSADAITVDGFSIINSNEGLYTKTDDNVIKNNAIRNHEKGVHVGQQDDPSRRNSIINNKISGCDEGISLDWDCYQTLINGNVISENGGSGIISIQNSYNTITENTIINNNDGIWFLHGSGSEEFTNNNISNNNIGIYWHSGDGNIKISNNTIKSNGHGIWIGYAILSEITGNNISRNKYGIYSEILFDTIICDNYVVDNTEFGLTMEGNAHSTNQIYNNYFDNTNNAYDYGTNIWNISNTPGTNIIGGPYIGGNYWSDYAGVDTDEDGLGDSPYNNILGGSNQDMLPLVKDFFISCDSSGDEKNMFMPGEGIYVKAEGLSPSTSYKVWIQDNPVSDGDALNTSEDPSGSQEVVVSDGSGSLSPTLIWDIPSDAAVTHHEYDIVLDLDSGPNVGMYNSASDRIDSTIAAGVTAPVPELTSIGMVLMGIMVILGYVRNNKEK